MANERFATAELIGPMRFDVTSGSGHTIVVDTKREGGGEDSGPSPVELVLMSLASCSGMDVISILRKKRQDVTSYEVRVRGVRTDEYPQVYTAIEIEHVITGHGVQPEAVARAIELSETKYCSVSAMLGATATLTSSYQVLEAPQPGD